MLDERLDEALHGCPACGDLVGRTRPTCDECWREVPRRLKRAVDATYRDRVADPVGYQEALAALLGWCRDRIVRREVAVSSWLDVEPLLRGVDRA